MKIKEIREKTIEELRNMLAENKEKARVLRFDIHTKQTKDHREYRTIKRDIAKVITILKEKKESSKKAEIEKK